MGEEDTRRRSTSPGCACSAPRSCPRRHRLANPEGRDQRGDARLGRRRRARTCTTPWRSHPFPLLVHDFQRVIEVEARGQVLDLTGRLPDAVAACVVLGSTRWVTSIRSWTTRVCACTASRPAATVSTPAGTPRRSPAAPRGCCTVRSRTCCRTRWVRPSSHARSPRVDYPGPGRARLAARHRPGQLRGRPKDAEAMEAFSLLCRTEGIIPAIETHTPWPGPAARAAARRGGGRAGPACRAVATRTAAAARWFGEWRGMTEAAGSRLSEAFERARSEGGAALVGYLPAGYPTAGAVAALRAMADAGVDVVEVGLPYSDPLMDRPTVQRAVDAALRGGTTSRRAADGRGGGVGGDARGRDVVLEPDRRVRARSLRPRARGSRWIRRRHPGPDPRRGRGGCRPLAVTGWTPCSWWRRRRPTSGSR